MIGSFKCKHTESLWKTGKTTRLPHQIIRVALRKLWQLDNAEDLKDLKAPPQNRLEALKGNRKDSYSIRINDQWRLCFRWKDKEAFDIEIVDYHH